MAARKLRPQHQEEIKVKIQTSQLVNRLQNHIDGKVELNATQVRGIEILLARTLPTLSSVEQTTHVDPIPTQVELDAMLNTAIQSMSNEQLKALGLMKLPTIVRAA